MYIFCTHQWRLFLCQKNFFSGIVTGKRICSSNMVGAKTDFFKLQNRLVSGPGLFFRRSQIFSLDWRIQAVSFPSIDADFFSLSLYLIYLCFWHPLFISPALANEALLRLCPPARDLCIHLSLWTGLSMSLCRTISLFLTLCLCHSPATTIEASHPP